MNRVTVETLLDLKKTKAAALFEGLTYPWAALPRLTEYIVRLGETLPAFSYERVAENVWIAHSARVSSKARIDGPCLIDEEAEVRQGAVLRGSVIVGRQAVVGGATELKNTLLFDGVKAAHGNYIGDTVAGYAVHFGAGAVTSNLRDDRVPVVVKVGETLWETGLRKVGAIIGDGARIGAGSVLCAGCVLGVGAVTEPLSCVESFVPQRHLLLRDGSLREILRR